MDCFSATKNNFLKSIVLLALTSVVHVVVFKLKGIISNLNKDCRSAALFCPYILRLRKTHGLWAFIENARFSYNDY